MSNIVKFITFWVTLCWVFTVSADDTPASFKPGGISLGYLSQQQPVRLNYLDLDHPHPALALVESAKGQIKTDSDVDITELKLDYWVRPYLNVFGVMAETEGTMKVRISELPGVDLPDMNIDIKGKQYRLGATTVYRNGDYFGALTYDYSVTKSSSSGDKTTTHTIIPTFGKVTDIGAFTLGMVNQKGKGSFQGTLNVPLLGDVKARAKGENAERISYLLGYHTRLAQDWYIRANVEVGDREGFKLELNRRF